MATRTSRQPIVTLTTDFGTSDHFVGTMKGVILGICPDARIVDITHEIPPFEISQGAFLIAEASRWFPRRTVHVVIVDPGVGTSRRPVLIEAGGQFYIGPDNGVLAMVYTDTPHKAREIQSDKYFNQPLSRTFHGRDIFAPVAAHLAAGVRPATFGPLIEDHLKLAFLKPQRTSKRVWTGTILHVDRFGNLITNFHTGDFPDVRMRPFQVTVGTRSISRLALNYADSEPGEAFAIEGSSGYLEIACNQVSAAKVLGCGTGAPVELTLY
jgi:S-adenosyl-L-methionine hydrolase (adenosine-forming)